MNIVDKLAIPAIVIAGGLIYLAEEFNMPFLIPLALEMFGVFAILLGVETIFNGEIKMFNRLYSRREYFSGLPARLYGVMAFLFGVGISLYGFLEWTSRGVAGTYLEGLVNSSRGWGILLLAFGFFTLLFGLIRLIAGSAHRLEERSGWVDFGYRARGLFNTVLGFILLVVGAWLFFK